VTAQRLRQRRRSSPSRGPSGFPYALTWDAETGAIRGVTGPRGFASYREAVEASRFLVRRARADAAMREIDAQADRGGSDEHDQGAHEDVGGEEHGAAS
jgi:hypothetical protein